jgi:hypothetical protein
VLNSDVISYLSWASYSGFRKAIEGKIRKEEDLRGMGRSEEGGGKREEGRGRREEGGGKEGRRKRGTGSLSDTFSLLREAQASQKGE